MSDVELLEKPQLLKSLPLNLPNLEAEFSEVAPKKFSVRLEVDHVADDGPDKGVFNVFMNVGRKRFQIDAVSEASLTGQTAKDKAVTLYEAFNQAYEDLSVTYQRASNLPAGNERMSRKSRHEPVLMAGWNVSGGENRFVLKHKGAAEVYRNMAYVIGSDARRMLELDKEPVEGLSLAYLQDVKRAHMIFKYTL